MDFEKTWNQNPEYVQSFDKSKKLPKPGEKNILITSALPYVNNVPHLGNIIGCVLSADAFSRYCYLKGWRRLFICGTDEYGTATERKAVQEGLTPRQICDKYHAIHAKIYKWFNIDFDRFGRTTTQHQTELTQEIFLKLHKNGFTSTDVVDQLHCDNCNRFLADRFVFGECPYCHFDDARGDQCDACGKLINAVEIINPRCDLCKATPVVKPSSHIFLHLDKLAGEVEKHLNKQLSSGKNHWSANAISIAKSWLKGGLERRCITRDLKWGVPVPIDSFSNKVFYVWFDAPIGYLSITKEYLGEDWSQWWKNPSIVDLYNFVGKTIFPFHDNVAFHAVMFPATQIGTGDNYTMVNRLCATEYLNYESTKFSKSRGTGVFGDMAAETGIDADIWRFYLLYIRPETQDTSFSWDDFSLKVNTELLNNLGNFVNRALMFLSKYFNGVVPDMYLEEEDKALLAQVASDLNDFDSCLSSVKLRDGIVKVLSISRHGNLYMQSTQPWVLLKGNENDRRRAGTVIGVVANLTYLIAVMIYPYMPSISEKIREHCGHPTLALLPRTPIAFLKPGHKIGEPKPLFVKMEKSTIDDFKKRFGGVDESVVNEQMKKKKLVNEGKKKAKNEEKDMASSSLYTKLLTNQKKIDSLLEVASMKLEQRRSLFEKLKVQEENKQTLQLEAEIERLKAKLIEMETLGGIKQVNIPKFNKKNLLTGSSSDTIPVVQMEKANEKDMNEVEALQREVKTKRNEDTKSKKGSKSDGEVKGDEAIDIGRLDIRVGRILKVEKHPDADSLYIEQIDVGEDKPRTIISGLVRHVSIEQMQNRLVICLCNLKPVKMRGIESQGMVLCASTSEKVELIEFDESCIPGQPVTCEGYKRRPDSILNPKKKIWEGVAPDLKVNCDGQVVYKGQPLLVSGISPLVAPSLRNVPVK
uniref:Methionine--tRNA ligase, cytoplasmic n=1 Tax=Loa loa TaxID=7209 RepID=A0A1I7V8K4_LOALO